MALGKMAAHACSRRTRGCSPRGRWRAARASDRDRNVWLRMEQLGVPLSDESRVEVPVQSFGWEALYDNPALVVTP